jgi:hypothetical protein
MIKHLPEWLAEYFVILGFLTSCVLMTLLITHLYENYIKKE